MVERGEGAPEPVRMGNDTKREAICMVEAKTSNNDEDQHTFDRHERTTHHAFIIVCEFLRNFSTHATSSRAPSTRMVFPSSPQHLQQ